MKVTNENIITGAKLVGVGFGLALVYKLAQKFGIIETREEKQAEQATASASASAQSVDEKNALLAFNPNYYKTLTSAWLAKFKPSVFPFSKNYPAKNELIEYSKRIYDAKGFFKDDNEKLYSVFRSIPTQYQLSVISQSFSNLYKKDLFEYIKGFLNESELKVILDIVANYPQFKK